MTPRTQRPSPMATSKYNVWKVRPPGPEQLELERMFRDREIDCLDSADSVHKAAVIPVRSDDVKSKIPELGSSQQHIVTSKPMSTTQDNEDDVETSFPINFSNAPFSTWTYTDHAKKTDYLCVVAPIISGSREVNFTLSDDGMKVTIHYTWPSAVYKPSVLFAQAIADKELVVSDPKIYAFSSEMVAEGLTDESKPRGDITIKLPYRVKRETNSFTFKAMKVEGANIAFMQFTAYQKSLYVDSANTTLNFD